MNLGSYLISEIWHRFIAITNSAVNTQIYIYFPVLCEMGEFHVARSDFIDWQQESPDDEWHIHPFPASSLKSLSYPGSAEPEITQFRIHWPLKKVSHAPRTAANKSVPKPDSLLTLVSGYTPSIKRRKFSLQSQCFPTFVWTQQNPFPHSVLHTRQHCEVKNTNAAAGGGIFRLHTRYS